MSASYLCWTLLGFVLGSIPFSYWLGRFILGIDIRDYGDHNPGAGNAWRAGGWQLGLPAGLLDYSKGALPVGIAHYGLGMSGWELLPVGIAPVLGHAFSPFLLFRGGKSVAATFGIWTGLTGLGGPLAFGFGSLIFWVVQDGDGLTMVMGMFGLAAFLILGSVHVALLLVWVINMLVITWKHRRDLRQPIHLRPYLLRARYR